MNLKQHIPNQVRTIAHILGEQNVRIVGGAVRDLLLGVTPKDFDLATTLLPEDVMDMLRGAGLTVLETGLQHGTVTAMVDGEPHEITTLRVDTETDGRHATVVFTDDWKLDAERRDLTINAMSMDMDGEVHDYFGGMTDLDEGYTRFVGDAHDRIEEDYLRILRYFRFVGIMGRASDPATLEVISGSADGLVGISGERIWMEMRKIFTATKHSVFHPLMVDMEQTGVLEAIGIDGLHADNHETARLARIMDAQDTTILAAYMNDLDSVDRINRDWKLSKNEYVAVRAITDLMLHHSGDFLETPLSWYQEKVVRNGVNREHVEEFVKFAGDQDLLDDFRDWDTPEFPVRGHDLLDVGFKPGPGVGDKLRELRNLWVDSGCKATRDELLVSVSGGS
jgi:tRNA nucleotidyltransferase (CCA-adding enzyme)